MKGQAAIEYLIVIGIGILILMPILYYSSKSFQNYKEDTNILAAKNTVEKIGENVDWVYAQGPPSRVQINVYIPEDIEQASIGNRTVLFKINSESGTKDVFYTTVCDMNGTLPTGSGFYYLSIAAEDNFVDINVV